MLVDGGLTLSVTLLWSPAAALEFEQAEAQYRHALTRLLEVLQATSK